MSDFDPDAKAHFNFMNYCFLTNLYYLHCPIKKRMKQNLIKKFSSEPAILLATAIRTITTR
mgnify:FL=1